jgi:hypothetical protein
MEIQKINLHSLLSEEHMQIHTDFRTYVTRYDPEKLKITHKYASYTLAYDVLDEAFKQSRKSMNTADVQKADKARDAIWTGMRKALQLALKHYDKDVVKAAYKVKIVFDTYGNVAKMSFNRETASVDNIIQDLQGKYSAEAATAGLTQWVTELKNANETFKNLMLERYDETTAQPSVTLRDARQKIDCEYRDIVKYINALIVVEGEDNYREFVTAFNTVIKRYADDMKQRKGRAAAKKEKSKNKD